MKGFFADADDAEEMQDAQECNKPKGTRRRVKPEEDVEPRTSKVYTINAKKSNVGNFKVLYSMITGYGWLRAESEDEFLRLFSGKANDCVITWIGKNEKGKKVGVGTLRELFEKMIQKGIVTCTNNEYIAVIESHFKTEEDKFLSGVSSSGYASSKTRPQVDDLIRVLSMTLAELVAQSRGVDHCAPTEDVTDGIDEEFGDHRYGQKQYWDDHKDCFD